MQLMIRLLNFPELFFYIFLSVHVLLCLENVLGRADNRILEPGKASGGGVAIRVLLVGHRVELGDRKESEGERVRVEAMAEASARPVGRRRVGFGRSVMGSEAVFIGNLPRGAELTEEAVNELSAAHTTHA